MGVGQPRHVQSTTAALAFLPPDAGEIWLALIVCFAVLGLCVLVGVLLVRSYMRSRFQLHAKPATSVPTRPRTADDVEEATREIAHDLSNAVMVIRGHAELLRESLPESDTTHSDAERIVGAARRAEELVNRLSDLSRD